MTIGHVFHRGPVESGPEFTIGNRSLTKAELRGVGGAGGGRGVGGGRGGYQRRLDRSLDFNSFKYTC
jgi:hypothetical protein